MSPQEKEKLDAEYDSQAATVTRRTIKAGSVEPINAYGANLFLIAATGNLPLYIATEKTAEAPFLPGTGTDHPRYFRFTTLLVRNPNPFDITIVLWTGFGEYKQNTFYLSANPSVPLPVVNTQLNALSGVALSGNPPADMIRRRSVLVSNLDPANVLEIYDKAPVSGGVPLFTVFPRSVVEFESDAPLYVYNATASAIPCRVSEVWLKL